jgi:hypothetical protein
MRDSWKKITRPGTEAAEERLWVIRRPILSIFIIWNFLWVFRGRSQIYSKRPVQFDKVGGYIGEHKLGIITPSLSGSRSRSNSIATQSPSDHCMMKSCNIISESTKQYRDSIGDRREHFDHEYLCRSGKLDLPGNYRQDPYEILVLVLSIQQLTWIRGQMK